MYIGGTGLCAPARESAATAVAAGWYDPDECELNGYTSVAVTDGRSAAETAVEAASGALAVSGHDPEDIRLVLHAGFFHQGRDHWTPASYIQQQTVGGRAPAIEIKQGSNGGLAGLELALSYLTTHQHGERDAALITTADNFCLPVYQRYRTDTWIVLGDGASAAVVSRKPGFARVVSTAMDSDPVLEEMYRGTGAFSSAPHGGPEPLDLRDRKREFCSLLGLKEIALRGSTGLNNVVDRALKDADKDIGGITRFVLPNVGKTLMKWQFLDVLGIGEERTTWEWGSEMGHMGAGDQFGGLHHLVTRGLLGPGDRVALVGSGIGFSWACTVLEIEETVSEGDR